MFNYSPQTKLRKGNIFTSVCQEFCPQGGRCTPSGTPPRRHPPFLPWQTPPGRPSYCSGRYASYWNPFLFLFMFVLALIYMSHFAYACKTEGENGISRLISALCVNCLISIPEYSRIIDYSIIWMCIWCGLLKKLYKIKKSELLNSKVYSKV